MLPENGMQEDSDVEMGLDNNVAEDLKTKAEEKKPVKSGGADYTIVQDEKGKKWYCEEGKRRQETVSHYDIRSILLHDAELSNLGGTDFKPKQGARPDDKTAYHRAYSFGGKRRQFRPDSLFIFRRYIPTGDLKPSSFFEWDGKIVLDYRITISSEVGGARLEAMRRSNLNIEFDDILARILGPGFSKTQVRNFKNKLSAAEHRWRNLARLVACKPKKGSHTLITYLRSIMTAEMIAKNTTRGLSDVVNGSDEADYMKMLNLGSAKASSRKKASNEEKREQDMKKTRNGASQWAQKQITWEAENQIIPSSTRTPLAADSIESIVAWKLASLNQQCANAKLAYPSSLTLPNSPPAFPLGDSSIDAFFGGEDSQTGDHSDPYRLLGRPPVSKAHACLVACILQAARDQFVEAKLGFASSFSYSPKTNHSQTYWQQIEALQHAFVDCWTEVGNKGDAPLLFRVMQLDRTTIRWNGFSIPILTAVEEYKERSIETLTIWQRSWARMQRKRLGLQQDGQSEEGDEVVGNKEGQEGGGESSEESGGEGNGSEAAAAAAEEEGEM